MENTQFPEKITMDANQIGELGTILVKHQLIKRGIHTVEMPVHYFDFYLYTNNHLRIEVKTARKRSDTVVKQGKYQYKETCWVFNNSKPDPKKNLDENETAERYYIVPAHIINHESSLIRIHMNKTERLSKSK